MRDKKARCMSWRVFQTCCSGQKAPRWKCVWPRCKLLSCSGRGRCSAEAKFLQPCDPGLRRDSAEVYSLSFLSLSLSLSLSHLRIPDAGRILERVFQSEPHLSGELVNFRHYNWQHSHTLKAHFFYRSYTLEHYLLWKATILPFTSWRGLSPVRTKILPSFLKITYSFGTTKRYLLLKTTHYWKLSKNTGCPLFDPLRVILGHWYAISSFHCFYSGPAESLWTIE